MSKTKTSKIEKYQLEVFRDDQIIASAEYDIPNMLTRQALTFNFFKDATPEDKTTLQHIAANSVFVIFGSKDNLQSSKIKGFKSGTYSHFLMLRTKLEKAGYSYKYSQNTEAAYKEILKDLGYE